MTDIASRINAPAQPHPPIEPFDRRMLTVGGGHSIYVESCGSPRGIPVLFLHGGPGGGCNPAMRRYFDPEIYRVILFDQRGCGRSKPAGCVEENTTWHLVEDMERIRCALGIENWILFGGSWGVALALVYAQQHPDRVIHLVLRGVFLMTAGELDWFYGGGAGRFRPDIGRGSWNRSRRTSGTILSKPTAGDSSAATPTGKIFHAQRWLAWENAMLTLKQAGSARIGSHAYAHTFARIENHYFRNMGFLGSDSRILDNMSRLQGIPGNIIQGRYDLICPPQAAWSLVRNWPDAKLEMVQAGHSLSEPEISRALLRTMGESDAGQRPSVAGGSNGNRF